MSGALQGVLLALTGAPGLINAALPSADNTSPGQAEVVFKNDGTFTYLLAGALQSDEWVTPALAGIAALYELQVNVSAGSLDAGTVDTWLPLSSNRGYVKSSVGSVSLRVRIREAASGAVRTDQTIGLVVNP